MSDNENQDEGFTVPSDPKVREAIRDRVQEAAAVMIQQDGLKDQLKAIVDGAAEDLEVPKRIFKRMAKAFHKQNYAAISQDDEVFQLFYENIVEGSKAN